MQFPNQSQIPTQKSKEAEDAFWSGYSDARAGLPLSNNPFIFDGTTPGGNELWWVYNEGWQKFQEVVI